MGKKITQLATITEVADDDLIVGVDVSDTSGSDNGTNKKFTKATLLDGLAPLNPQLTGWNPDAETWVYHNVDDPTGYFKIEGKDVSANYSVGWRIMFTNGGNVIKGIITAVTFTDPDTIITFLHEIDPTDNQALYLLTNSAITENYFSPHKAPLGFPMSPTKWQLSYSDAKERVTSTVVIGTWYNTGSHSLVLHIGSWKVHYEVCLGSHGMVGGYNQVHATLSTANNSEVSTTYRAGIRRSGNGDVYENVSKDFILDIAAKATYYLNIRAYESTSVANLLTEGHVAPTKILATCAYL